MKVIVTPTEKLLQLKFRIASEKKLHSIMNKKEAVFFKRNFFMEKEKYIAEIIRIINSINETGYSFKDAREMADSGSIIHSFASSALGDMYSDYRLKRKTLENHVAFFKTRV